MKINKIYDTEVSLHFENKFEEKWFYRFFKSKEELFGKHICGNYISFETIRTMIVNYDSVFDKFDEGFSQYCINQLYLLFTDLIKSEQFQIFQSKSKLKQIGVYDSFNLFYHVCDHLFYLFWKKPTSFEIQFNYFLLFNYPDYSLNKLKRYSINYLYQKFINYQMMEKHLNTIVI